MADFHCWRHVFKVDPDKEIDDSVLEAVCESGTDAVIVGGSEGVTRGNTLHLLSRIRRFSVPCLLEISSLASITPGFDFYLIPTVLNSRKAKWVIGQHHQAVKEWAHLINWEETVPEGYCVCHADSGVARLTDADTGLTGEDVCAYALLAEHFFHLPIFYLEYSGTYGDPRLVHQVSRKLNQTKLFYGGGIETPEQAEEMAQYADTIVVGNAIYENIEQALKTVKAIRQQ